MFLHHNQADLLKVLRKPCTTVTACYSSALGSTTGVPKERSTAFEANRQVRTPCCCGRSRVARIERSTDSSMRLTLAKQALTETIRVADRLQACQQSSRFCVNTTSPLPIAALSAASAASAATKACAASRAPAYAASNDGQRGVVGRNSSVARLAIPDTDSTAVVSVVRATTSRVPIIFWLDLSMAMEAGLQVSAARVAPVSA